MLTLFNWKTKWKQYQFKEQGPCTAFREEWCGEAMAICQGRLICIVCWLRWNKGWVWRWWSERELYAEVAAVLCSRGERSSPGGGPWEAGLERDWNHQGVELELGLKSGQAGELPPGISQGLEDQKSMRTHSDQRTLQAGEQESPSGPELTWGHKLHHAHDTLHLLISFCFLLGCWVWRNLFHRIKMSFLKRIWMLFKR